MELHRRDYAEYLRSLRACLARIRTTVADPGDRNDVDCAIRVLTMMEAERAVVTQDLPADLPAYHALGDALEAWGGTVDRPDPAAPDAMIADAVVEGVQAHFDDLAGAAARGDAGASSILATAARLEFRRLQGVNAMRKDLEDTAQVERRGVGAALATPEAGVLTAYLRTRFPHESGLSVDAVRRIPGGRSKETVAITLSGVTTLPEKIIMRADMAGGLVPSKVTDEFELLRVVAAHGGVPVPMPILDEPDPSALGRAFILVSAVEGSTKGDYFPEVNGQVAGDRTLGIQLAQILARLHMIDASTLSGTSLDFGQDAVGSARQVIERTYEEARGIARPARLHLDIAHRWLMDNIALAQDDKVLIHCDVGLHNMLIADGRITAMLDWELATFASPAREIAKILHLIDYLIPRQEFLDAYVAAGGSRSVLDADRVTFYAVLNYMVTCQRTRLGNAMFFNGQPSILRANSAYDFYHRTSSILIGSLREALNLANANNAIGAIQP